MGCRLLLQGFRRLPSQRLLCPLIFNSRTSLIRTASILTQGKASSQPLRNQSILLLRSFCTAPSATGFNDYDSEVASFKLDVPEYFNFAKDVIDEWSEVEKTNGRELPAFWWVDDDNNELKWTFGDISEKSKKTANVLQDACGLGLNDRVIVILPRIPQWWLINVACFRTGSVLIPGTTQLTANDIHQRLLKSGATCVITDYTTAEKVDQVIEDCPHVTKKLLVDTEEDICRNGWMNFAELYKNASSSFECVQTRSDDTMTIFFTSGTTGLPKMTEHTHASYGIAAKITGKYWLDLSQEDIHWNLSDTGWAKTAWSNLFAPWTQGACVFVHHTPKFDAVKTLQVLEKYPVTTFCTSPTAYRMLVLEDIKTYDLTSLRHCVSAGEPLNPEVIDIWKLGSGSLIREGYGQTETVLQCGMFRCIPYKSGSMGKPAPGIPLVLVNDDGEELGIEEEGNLAIRTEPDRPVGLFKGYVDDPERTAHAYLGSYYLTGDKAMRDEDGYLWFLGRCDDVITSAGYRIGPFEVESALLEHPSVAESAVVSSPDKIRGAIVKAFVTLTDEHKDRDPDELMRELQEHVRNTTAPYKYPRKIEFVHNLPKTVSGKIRRVELRQKEWENHPDAKSNK